MFDLYPLHRKSDPVKKYKLMLKCHWETGISYLCVTSKKKWETYKGSGLRWKKLLNKHKSKIDTTLIFTSDDKEEFNSACVFYSDFFDIVSDKNFANLIIETGYKDRPFVKKVEYDVLVEAGKKGGSINRKNKTGIFAEENQKYRKDWARIGAQALAESGNRSGIFDKTWRENNKECVKDLCSKGGKIGGKKTGKMFWWNNGIINKKSFVCPGEGWVRGMIMSEKKRTQVYAVFAGHNRKVNINV